jgi:hypothetical protein
MAAAGVTVKEVATTKIDGQKTGTSGLRKKAKEFSSGSYLANWVQSLFNALPKDQRVRASTFLGSGRASLWRGCRATPRRSSPGARACRALPTGAGGARPSCAAARRIGRVISAPHNRSSYPCAALLAPPRAPAADWLLAAGWRCHGAGRRRAVVQQGGCADHHQACGWQRRGQDVCRPRRLPVHAGCERGDPRAQGVGRVHHVCVAQPGRPRERLGHQVQRLQRRAGAGEADGRHLRVHAERERAQVRRHPRRGPLQGWRHPLRQLRGGGHRPRRRLPGPLQGE